MQLFALLPLLVSLLPPTTARLNQGQHLAPSTTHSQPDKRVNIANLAVNTCVRLAADSTIKTKNKSGTISVNSFLAAGTCLCIDTVSNVGILDPLGTSVQVVSSTGVTYTGATAIDIAKAVSRFYKTFVDTMLMVSPFSYRIPENGQAMQPSTTSPLLKPTSVHTLLYPS
jgi:hypothetical protein